MSPQAATPQIEGLPPGAVIKPIQLPSQQVDGLPPGAVIKPISQPAAQNVPPAAPIPPPVSSAPAPIRFLKGAAKTYLGGTLNAGPQPGFLEPPSPAELSEASQKGMWQTLKDSFADSSFGHLFSNAGNEFLSPVHSAVQEIQRDPAEGLGSTAMGLLMLRQGFKRGQNLPAFGAPTQTAEIVGNLAGYKPFVPPRQLPPGPTITPPPVNVSGSVPFKPPLFNYTTRAQRLGLMLPEKATAPIQLGPGEALPPTSPEGLLPAAPRFLVGEDGNPRVQFLTSPATDQVATPNPAPESAQSLFRGAPAQKPSLLSGIREHEFLSKVQDQIGGQEGDEQGQQFLKDWMESHNQHAPGAKRGPGLMMNARAADPLTTAIEQANAQGQAVLPPDESPAPGLMAKAKKRSGGGSAPVQATPAAQPIKPRPSPFAEPQLATEANTEDLLRRSLDAVNGKKRPGLMANVPNGSKIESMKADKGAGSSPSAPQSQQAVHFPNSKVVDATGKPLTVYHGTDAQFEKFNSAINDGANSKAFPQGKGIGHFFTEDPDFASAYGQHTKEVNLNIQKPFLMSKDEFGNQLNSIGGEALKAKLKAQGYDGIVLEPKTEKLGRFDVTSPRNYIAFDPEQIHILGTKKSPSAIPELPDLPHSGGKTEPVENRGQYPDLRAEVDKMSPEDRQRAIFISDKTDLPNSRAFDIAEGHGKAPAVAMSDADGLKALNDKFGYQAGDALLKTKAEALREAGLEAYHDKGDEFKFRGQSPEDLKTKLDDANERLKTKVIKVETADGKVLKFQGAQFSYGTGENLGTAEEGLKADKAAREAAGKRKRGELGGIKEVK